MKNKTILFVAAITAGSLQANIVIDPIVGQFLTGPLAGTAVTGFIDINENGLLTGTADTNPLTNPSGILVDLGFQFENLLGDLVFFDLFDDFDPLATFSNGQFTGLDYFGTNLDGDFLSVFYDAFAPDAATGILITFESFSGQISEGTLDLPTNVPEPGTSALLLGLAALGTMAVRRRRA